MPARKVSFVSDRLYIAQNIESVNFGDQYQCFYPKDAVQYQNYCDDFGPLNLQSIARFIHHLDKKFATFPESKIVFCVDKGRRSLTNAILLSGAYMILKEQMTAREVETRFASLDSTLLEPYRDATYTKSDFDLKLKDCWRGLD